jgi:hypothetical protein
MAGRVGVVAGRTLVYINNYNNNNNNSKTNEVACACCGQFKIELQKTLIELRSAQKNY